MELSPRSKSRSSSKILPQYHIPSAVQCTSRTEPEVEGSCNMAGENIGLRVAGKSQNSIETPERTTLHQKDIFGQPAEQRHDHKHGSDIQTRNRGGNDSESRIILERSRDKSSQPETNPGSVPGSEEIGLHCSHITSRKVTEQGNTDIR